MRAFVIFLALITTAFGVMTPTLYAQQAPPAGQHDDVTGLENQPGRGKTLTKEQWEEIRKKIETIKIWRLTEKLRLDTTTSAKLASLLGSFDQQRQGIIHEQMETMREMRVFLKAPNIDETKIKADLDKLEKNQHSLQELREKEYSELKNVLTIEQQARFLLFQQEFRRDIQRMISNARGNGRDRGSMAGQ